MPTDKDINQLLRRVDIDRDNKISYLELAVLLMPEKNWLANPNFFPNYMAYHNFWLESNPVRYNAPSIISDESTIN